VADGRSCDSLTTGRMVYPSRLNLDEPILSLDSNAVPASLYIPNILLTG